MGLCGGEQSKSPICLRFAGEGGEDLAAGFDDGDVYVEEAEAAEGATEVLVHPQIGQEAGVEGNPVDIPTGEPGEDEQKQTQFEGEDDEANTEDAAVPADEGGVTQAVAPANKSI